MTNRWTAADLADQDGRVFVITGANSGIGFEAARSLAAKRATVVLACRSEARAQAAIDEILVDCSTASLHAVTLDLASLQSVRDAATQLQAMYPVIHALINNAGVMALPYRKTTDGFEMQLGTNHIGHYALTGLLMAPLRAAGDARVVTVSSVAHRMGRMNFDDPQSERRYQRWKAYGQSKLANLLFTYELSRRLRAASIPVSAVACHPGYSSTNLQLAGPRMAGSTLEERISSLGNRVLAQSAAMGALPTLYAATHPDVQSGDYIGPDGFGEMWGCPRKVSSTARARDEVDARRLWSLSRQLSGVHYPGDDA